MHLNLKSNSEILRHITFKICTLVTDRWMKTKSILVFMNQAYIYFRVQKLGLNPSYGYPWKHIAFEIFVDLSRTVLANYSEVS